MGVGVAGWCILDPESCPSVCVCVCVAVWLPGDTGVVVSLAWQAAYVRHFVVAATRRMRNAK